MVTPPKISPPEVFEVNQALEAIRRRARLPPRPLQVLSYVIAQTITGRGEQLSQKKIAEEVFGHDIREFNPRAISVVRTTFTKLRERLMGYYAGRGQDDPVVIELPAGSYLPKFSRRPRLSAASMSLLWSARMALESRTVTGFETAVRHLDCVLAEAPDLSLALALKAEALASHAIHGARPLPLLNEARDLARRAVEQPRAAWQAWLAQGIVQQALDWDWTGAEESYGNAIALSGGEAAHHVWHTAFLVGRGRASEAISHLQGCVDRYGYSNPTCVGDLCMLLILARDYDAASLAIGSAVEASPLFYQHHMNRAILLEAQGDPRAAAKALDSIKLSIEERPVMWAFRSLLDGLSGKPRIARRRIGWLRNIEAKGKYVPPLQFALCELGAGNCDAAVRCLEEAAAHRDPLTVWFHAYPFLRHLWKHPGFQRLIERIGTVPLYRRYSEPSLPLSSARSSLPAAHP